MPRMTKSDFQRVVRQALEELPQVFQDALDNLDVQVRWAPTVHERRRARLRPGSDLFGLDVGIPITKRTHGYSMVLPDTILIYQRAHEPPAGGENEGGRVERFRACEEETGPKHLAQVPAAPAHRPRPPDGMVSHHGRHRGRAR